MEQKPKSKDELRAEDLRRMIREASERNREAMEALRKIEEGEKKDSANKKESLIKKMSGNKYVRVGLAAATLGGGIGYLTREKGPHEKGSPAGEVTSTNNKKVENKKETEPVSEESARLAKLAKIGFREFYSNGRKTWERELEDGKRQTVFSDGHQELHNKDGKLIGSAQLSESEVTSGNKNGMDINPPSAPTSAPEEPKTDETPPPAPAQPPESPKVTTEQKPFTPFVAPDSFNFAGKIDANISPAPEKKTIITSETAPVTPLSTAELEAEITDAKTIPSPKEEPKAAPTPEPKTIEVKPTPNATSGLSEMIRRQNEDIKRKEALRREIEEKIQREQKPPEVRYEDLSSKPPSVPNVNPYASYAYGGAIWGRPATSTPNSTVEEMPVKNPFHLDSGKLEKVNDVYEQGIDKIFPENTLRTWRMVKDHSAY
jgi:hypothetical protein